SSLHKLFYGLCIFKGKTITKIGIIIAADKYHSFGIFLNQSWNKKIRQLLNKGKMYLHLLP
ncbi:hypothetical protein HMPREF3210_01065, partial [Lactobacillus gasseri]